MLLIGVPIPRVPQFFAEGQDEAPLPDTPAPAAQWGVGGETRDKSEQLGTEELDSRTFTRECDCWLGSMPKIKIILGLRNNPNNSVVAFTF